MKNKPGSKKSMVLNHLKRGQTLTALQALRLYGVGRLASTVHRLKREGFVIKKNMIYNLLNEGYAEYYIPQSK